MLDIGFEVAPPEYWKILTSIDEVQLFLFFCNANNLHDWRVPAITELHAIRFGDGYPTGPKWILEDFNPLSARNTTMSGYNNYSRILIPVRTNYGL